MGRQRGPNEDTRFSLVPRDALGVAFYAFLTDCRARCLSPRTIALYQQKWEKVHAIFLEWGVTRVQDISAQHIRDLLTELGRTHNRGGVRCHYRVLKTFLRWCVGEGIIQDNPIARIQTPPNAQECAEKDTCARSVPFLFLFSIHFAASRGTPP